LEPSQGTGTGINAPSVNLQQLLKAMVEKGASDLHITTGSPPQLRIDGSLVPLRVNAMSPTDTKQICYSVLTDTQKMRFEEDQELDFSFGVRNLARFRANLFLQRGAVGGVFRTIPFKIASIADLGLPSVLEELCNKPRGLVLVTGPTGSGKSTTLAAMIDKINTERHEHIITVEDPIEYLHAHKACVVNQREVGADTNSFKKALKYILRQDPDVVLIGEMRDLETIEAALVTAETGHLCFATLHTNSAVQTINRIIDVFPPNQQSQIRAQLSFVLEGIVSQTLLPKATGTGRVPALEVMIPNAAIRNLIREDKVHQLYSQMQIGQGKSGMQTLNQCLASLYIRRHITLEEAVSHSSEPEELQQIIATGGNQPQPTQRAGAYSRGGRE
jgi:twitching motility protein PilT